MSLLVDFIIAWKTTIAVVCFIVGVKLWLKFTTGVFKSDKKMTGKTVIVTGANSGIGKETALDLARRGARVILACRDLQKANEARDEIVAASGNGNVVVLQLDLASLTSVREFAQKVLGSESRLDVLINNAGALRVGAKKTSDGLEIGMQTNHFGPFLLTNLLVDLMKKSPPSRIIFVSSLGHINAKFDVENMNSEKVWLGELQIYCCSKLANILTANELARKLSGTGVTVNSLHPGVVETEITRNTPPVLRHALNLIFWFLFKSAEEGAQTTLYLAVSDEVEGVSGKYFSDCKETKTSPLASDSGLAKKVWEKSENFVKL